MVRHVFPLLFLAASLLTFSSCGDSDSSTLQDKIGASAVSSQAANVQLYSKYFSQENLTTRGGGKGDKKEDEQQLDALLEAGFEAYHAENYNQAITHFQKFAEKRPDNRQVPYYLSLSYLAMEDVDSAQPYLEQLLSTPDALYYEHAQWYMALVHLHREELEPCAKYLEQIIQVDWHYFNERAHALLSQVKYLQEHGGDLG